MNTEIEAKFANVDHNLVRQELKRRGAHCEQPMRLMRRAVFHNTIMRNKSGFMRVRDEGYRVTMTYKQFDDRTIHGAKELEIIVDNFEVAGAMLEQAGLTKSAYQETRRETWKLGDVEVVLDQWPWLKPFIEIEGPSELAVRGAAEQLGFEWSNARFGGVAHLYCEEYAVDPEEVADIINREIPVIRFEDPVPLIIQQGKRR